MGLIVRQMAAEEALEVSAMYCRSLLGSLSFMRPEQLRTEADYRWFFCEILSTSRDVWVAEQDGAVLAVLALFGAELDRLYVAPEAQNQGLGSLLLAKAKGLNPEGLVLVTHQRNLGVRRFYERHGFAVERFGVSGPPEDEPDVWYRWRGHASATATGSV